MPEQYRVAILVDTAKGYDRGLLKGIAKFASLQKSWVFIKRPQLYKQRLSHAKNILWLKETICDGVVVRVEDAQQMAEIQHMKSPAVVMSYSSERLENGFCYLEVNNQKVGQMAAEYFINRGYRNFAFCGYNQYYWSNQRLESYRRALKEKSFRVWVYRHPRPRKFIDVQRERMLVMNWLKTLPRPIAIFTANDERAEQVVNACQLAELTVPEEIAVLGVDDDDMVCSMTTPLLSSINLNLEKAGYQAAEALQELMITRTRPVSQVVIEPTRVITRSSTDVYAIQDSELLTALQFIQQNADTPIDVDAVATAAMLSRRTLERRFKKYLKRSVLDEIRRARIARIQELLIETPMPITRIAMKLGFENVDRMGRYFRRKTGFCPRFFRDHFGQVESSPEPNIPDEQKIA